MVRNIWFHCLIASMTGTKSSNAEINVHEVGDLEIFFTFSRHLVICK